MFELVPYYGAISSLMDFCYGIPLRKFVFFVYGIVGNFNTEDDAWTPLVLRARRLEVIFLYMKHMMCVRYYA